MIKIFEFWKNGNTRYYDVKSLGELLDVVPHLIKNGGLIERIEIFNKENDLIWPSSKKFHTWKDLLKILK